MQLTLNIGYPDIKEFFNSVTTYFLISFLLAILLPSIQKVTM